MPIEITKKQIFDIWISKVKIKRLEAVFSFVMGFFIYVSFSEAAVKSIKSTLRTLCLRFDERWTKSGRHRERFENTYSTWLNETLTLPQHILDEIPSSSHSTTVGRPRKSFDDCCEKSKKRKVKIILDSFSAEEIAMAHEINLRKDGKRNTAIVVKQLFKSSPNRGSIVRKTLETHTSGFLPITTDDALALITDIQLSTHQYEILRQQINKTVPNLLPSYYKFKEAKTKCYPSDKTVSESSAECQLQSLLNHSVERLCLAQKDVLNSVADFKTGLKELSLIIKWGCDGAQQKSYKQKFSPGDHSDENLFCISMVPIQMYFLKDETKIVLWQNPAPSSTRYCRPIKLNFAKETTELIKFEVESIQKQIKALLPVEINYDSLHIIIKPIFLLTMIDGKICTALSSITSSSQTCYICAAKPSEMNNLANLSKKHVNQEAMSFGLSPLHSWIRFMECILHIAYRLDVKVWQVRDQENKEKVKGRKKLIQERFRSETGLLIDMPTQQSGNTNDGNTARRFFRDEEKTAQITGIDKELIKKFHIILEALGSGFPIDTDAFESYTRETRELYLKNYAWYYMPVSVHKVLFHGKQIILSCILPIGQLSEEAQEARNKENRKFRELFTRKMSRVDTNADLLNRLLITSDPFLASLRCIPKRKKQFIEHEVLQLLDVPNE